MVVFYLVELGLGLLVGAVAWRDRVDIVGNLSLNTGLHLDNQALPKLFKYWEDRCDFNVVRQRNQINHC